MPDPTPLDLDALEAAAKAASPGPWQIAPNSWASDTEHGRDVETWPELRCARGITVVDMPEIMGEAEAANWEHIAAFNPATALALIARLRAAEAAREAHARVLAHALRPPTEADDELACAHGWGPDGIKAVLAARLAAAKGSA